MVKRHVEDSLWQPKDNCIAGFSRGFFFFLVKSLRRNSLVILSIMFIGFVRVLCKISAAVKNLLLYFFVVVVSTVFRIHNQLIDVGAQIINLF